MPHIIIYERWFMRAKRGVGLALFSIFEGFLPRYFLVINPRKKMW